MISAGRVAAEPLVIYVHYPFCAALCTYCNFNKYLERGTVDPARLQTAFLTALDRSLALVDGATVRPVRSIYFGGGTPSLAPPRLIAAIVERVAARCRVAPDVEVTLEVNPTSTEAARLAALRAAGVNRLSLGVQALRDAALRRLGRQHSVADALATWRTAVSLFPGRTSMDLIWGRPGHDVAAWRAELREALAIADGHLSLYHLALEKGTRLERQHRARPADFPATGEVDAMMAATVEETAEAGYVQYEASSFARPSHESRHNSAYWRGLDYVGVGPGAHGRCFSIARPGERERRVQIALPEAWMAATEAGQDGCAKATPLSRSEMAEELVMLGMQLREGVDAARFLLYTGTPLVEFIDRAAAEQLQQDGFVKLDDRGLRPTARGMSLIDSLVPRLLLTN